MSTRLFDLTGRLALVTGASRGIGYAIAEGIAAAGAEVVLNARNPKELEDACARLAAAGHKVHPAAFDVTDIDAVRRAVDGIEKDIGPLAILFNNAGIQRRTPLVDFEPETWRDVMATNVDAVFYVGQAVARHMIRRGRGRIINTCSLASEVARATITPYTTAKGAVKMLTKGMAIEWAPLGLHVNGIGPGYFRTELNTALFDDTKFTDWLKSRTPAGRWGDVKELQGVAIFLASDASTFVNGQVIYVDGGFLAGM
jgi:gluconate 5-dehydrogenase